MFSQRRKTNSTKLLKYQSLIQINVLKYNKNDLICQAVMIDYTKVSSSVIYLMPIFQSESERNRK